MPLGTLQCGHVVIEGRATKWNTGAREAGDLEKPSGLGKVLQICLGFVGKVLPNDHLHTRSSRVFLERIVGHFQDRAEALTWDQTDRPLVRAGGADEDRSQVAELW